jgi:hypothetical protein
MAKPDPTKEPEFQKVVQAFLHTKPQPHKPLKSKQRAKATKRKGQPNRLRESLDATSGELVQSNI